MTTFLVGALLVIALCAVLGFIGNNLGVYTALTGDTTTFIGNFVFALLGAIGGHLAGWGFDFGPQFFGVYYITTVVGAILVMFLLPAIIEAT
jgi:uncharacterized membrane protein YeaQ/YmgE (transglycosylase-associated protein family)